MFKQNLSHQTIRADKQNDLDVLCSIHGKPAPEVIWQYNGGSLPDVVTVISESDGVNGKLTTVNRRLRWTSKSTLDDRRSTGGEYTCIGRVAGNEIQQSVNIDVQCKPNIKMCHCPS